MALDLSFGLDAYHDFFGFNWGHARRQVPEGKLFVWLVEDNGFLRRVQRAFEKYL